MHAWTGRYGVGGVENGDAFANASRAMQHFGVGNGVDPFGTSAADFRAASALGWPISFSPMQGGNLCFQVPGCVNNMTVEQHSRLQILDDANVYYEIQFAEWGYYFSGLQPAKVRARRWQTTFHVGLFSHRRPALCSRAEGTRSGGTRSSPTPRATPRSAREPHETSPEPGLRVSNF